MFVPSNCTPKHVSKCLNCILTTIDNLSLIDLVIMNIVMAKVFIVEPMSLSLSIFYK